MKGLMKEREMPPPVALLLLRPVTGDGCDCHVRHQAADQTR